MIGGLTTGTVGGATGGTSIDGATTGAATDGTPTDGTPGVGNGARGSGAGGSGDDGLPAAISIAFIAASLSLPANMMPDSVPVKNVAIGIINSKNFWSIGEIAFNGCVTKMIEYNTTNTIPVKVNAKQIPMKKRKRAISWSSV